jgi:integrase
MGPRARACVAKVLGLPVGSFATKAEAKVAREQARLKLKERQAESITLNGWYELWTTRPRYQRAKDSTNVTNHNACRPFVKKHGHLELAQVTRKVAAAYLRDDGKDYMVQSLRVMFADAVKDDLIDSNPFANQGVKKTKGNADKAPPTIEQVQQLITTAAEVVSPYFAGWLAVGCYAGMRPGEIDALRWSSVDFDADRIDVLEQYSAQSKVFTLPKNGKTRRILLPPQARSVLLGLPRVSEFCFVNFKGDHYGKSGRTYPWAMVRHVVDNRSVYQATRHFCGWFLYEHLRMQAEDVAVQLGHEDGGELVRMLYGHHDRNRALDGLLRRSPG